MSQQQPSNEFDTEPETPSAPTGQPEKGIQNILETPPFPLNYPELWDVTKLLIKSAVPTALTFIVGTLTGLSSLKFVGTYGTAAELAGASFGYTWVNIFCLGFFFSIDQGFSVIASRLFGANKHGELGVLYQRNVCIIMTLAVPLIISLIFTDNILIGLGLDYETSINTGIFLRHLIPCIISAALFNSTRYFLMAQNIFNVQSIILAILTPFHFFWTWLFVAKFEMVVSGAAIAKSITDTCAVVALILYIKYSNCCKESWIPWSMECLKGWTSHLKQTLTIGANLYVEWISYELSMLFIGLLNNKYVLGAHGMAISFTTSVFMLPLGTTVSMHTYIGNAVGEGSVYKSQKILLCGLSINSVVAFVNTFLMVFCNKAISEFFISDPESANALSNMLFIYGLAHMPDVYTNALGGILRIIGREKEVLTAFFICYFGLGSNMQWIFGVWAGFGYIAIWMSMATAICVMFCVVLRKIQSLDWRKEIETVKKGMEGGHGKKVVVEKGINDDYIELKEMP